MIIYNWNFGQGICNCFNLQKGTGEDKCHQKVLDQLPMSAQMDQYYITLFCSAQVFVLNPIAR